MNNSTNPSQIIRDLLKINHGPGVLYSIFILDTSAERRVCELWIEFNGSKDEEGNHVFSLKEYSFGEEPKVTKRLIASFEDCKVLSEKIAVERKKIGYYQRITSLNISESTFTNYNNGRTLREKLSKTWKTISSRLRR